jgi:hypothetical protein
VTGRRNIWRVLAGSVSGVVLVGVGGALVAPSAAADETPTVVTFGFTGATQSWTVPVGVESATFTLNGAQGGQGGGIGAHTAGGQGGTLVATLPVVAGDSYAVVVGGRGADALHLGAGGAGGFNGGADGGYGTVLIGNGSAGGGGGGGATDVRYGGSGLGDRLLVAGGGGGSSGSNSWLGPVPIVRSPSSPGGAGGAVEDDATAGGSDPSGGDGGAPGTSTAGGSGAIAHGAGGTEWNGTDGVVGRGGTGGGFSVPGGGGGGGGWFGGGGGANGNNPNTSADAGYQGAGGGGGGGSGRVDPAQVTHYEATAGAHAGTGSVIISFVVRADRIAPTLFGPGRFIAPYDLNWSYRYVPLGSPEPTVTLTSGELPPGLELSPNGSLHGWTTGTGTFTYTLTASNGVGRPASVTTQFTVAVAQEIATIAGTPPGATVGTPYDFSFTLGGDPAPTTTVTEGDLPPGLTLGTDGHLSGTPTTAGTYDFTVTADKAPSTAFGNYRVTVENSPVSITGTPPSGTVGTAYDFTYTLGGTASTTVTAGGLPPGLTLGADGHLSGTPTADGPFGFTVTADNGNGSTVSREDTITVQADPATIAGTPPSGTVAATYDFTYTLGGHPTTTVTAGGLPPGIALGSDGHLSGTPTIGGTYAFTVTADNGHSSAVSLRNTITVQGPAPTISGTPPSGAVGQAYSFTFTTSGSPAVTRSAGTLPAGLTLSPTGKLAGTPTRSGTFPFTVRATASGRSVDRAVSLVITASPSLSIGDRAVMEGNSGRKELSLPVSLSRASTVPVTVRWATVNGTAVAGSDYVAASGTVTFAPGQTAKTVTIQVKGDRTKERAEAFVVRLTSPTHATVARASGIGGIVNDD